MKLLPIERAGVTYPLGRIPADTAIRLKNRLTFQSPVAYMSRGAVNVGTPIYAYREENGVLYLPRHIPWSEFGLPRPIRLGKPLCRPVAASFTQTVRAGQQEPLAALYAQIASQRDGIFSLACGKGKTVLALAAWCRTHTPGLAIVPTLQIGAQWRERLLEFTTLTEDQIGSIYGGHRGHWGEKAFVIATIQTLMQRTFPAAFYTMFGTVFYDECVDGEALVPTPEGPRKLATLHENDSVLSFNETSNVFEFQKVRHTWSLGKRSCVNVVTTQGNLRVTPEHLFLTVGGWKEAQQLIRGESIISSAPVNLMRRLRTVSVAAENNYPFEQRGSKNIVSPPCAGDVSKRGTTEGNHPPFRFLQMYWRWCTALCSAMPVSATPTQPPLFLACPSITVGHKKGGRDIRRRNYSHSVLMCALGQTEVTVPSLYLARLRDTLRYERCTNRFVQRDQKPLPRRGLINFLMRRWLGGTWTMEPSHNPVFTCTQKAIRWMRMKCLQHGLGVKVLNAAHGQIVKGTGSCCLTAKEPTRCSDGLTDSFPTVWPTNAQVLSVELVPSGVEVYDIEVEHNHNFVANGLVVHNCHRLGAPLFSTTGGLFDATRIGLSATWQRADNLERLFMLHMGPLFYEDHTQELVPTVSFIQSPVHMSLGRFHMWHGAGELNYGKIITALSRDESRQSVILGLIQQAYAVGRKILVLGDRKEELSLYADVLEDRWGIQAGVCVGSLEGRIVRQTERDTALQQRVVLATSQLVKEGLDQPDFDTAIILYPKSNSAFAEQAAGRILRTHAGKGQPMVLVLQDDGCVDGTRHPFSQQCKSMAASFRRLGYTIEREAV